MAEKQKSGRVISHRQKFFFSPGVRERIFPAFFWIAGMKISGIFCQKSADRKVLLFTLSMGERTLEQWKQMTDLSVYTANNIVRIQGFSDMLKTEF
ncbi:MAG: hypothetical protein DRI57_30570 [Deltaproteobacteria bacterium]|nr:MAG: hypothetical protein DRI57_30570 [Deltaproteobacteria bacterium]